MFEVGILEFLGDAGRMCSEWAVKTLLEGKPGGGRKKGPRLKWLDDNELDLRNVGVRRWGTRAVDEEDGRLSWGKPRPKGS